MVEVLRTDNAPQRVTDKDIRAARDVFLAGDSTPIGGRIRTAAVEASPIPDFHPAFKWPIGEHKGPPLLVDDIGNLWVLPSQSDAGESLEWTVLSEDGEHICEVALPRELRPYQIGEDFVIGWVSDEDGVEYVRMYELVKH